MIEVTFITPEEMPVYLDIRKKVFVEGQKISLEDEIDEYDVVVPNRHILMIADGIPCGTARLKDLGNGVIKYQRIAVLSEKRGSGLGLALVLGVDKLARELGFTSVIIEAQQYAEPFYHKCGFTTIDGRVFFDCNIPHVMMEKEL